MMALCTSPGGWACTYSYLALLKLSFLTSLSYQGSSEVADRSQHGRSPLHHSVGVLHHDGVHNADRCVEDLKIKNYEFCYSDSKIK